MNERIELREDAVRALRLLAQAPLPEGMAERLTAGLQRRQRAAAPASPRVPAVYALAALSLALGMAALWVSLLGTEPIPAAQDRAAVQPHQALVGSPAPRTVAAKQGPTGKRAMRGVMESAVAERVSPGFLNPPPLPLSAQERLLLQLARSPEIARAPAAILRTVVVVNHGVGLNTIFELDHQNPSPLQSTLQTQPIQGDIE